MAPLRYDWVFGAEGGGEEWADEMTGSRENRQDKPKMGAQQNQHRLHFATEPSLHEWQVFACRFKAENKKLEDEPRSGRPTAISFDELKNLAEQHPCEGVRYFAASFACSLSTHHLEEKRYDDRDHLKNDLRAFFAFKSPKFYVRGIRDLVRRWQKVVDVDGDYFVV
ncbi:hypothetical protein RB195_014231 [Necator americanus]|uniref:Uncharacterized protein n=1 Tax=Necator americanus TaxID=51031 RepID=A0ABR1E0E4_NECAM